MNGLSLSEVTAQRAQYGFNELPEHRTSLFILFLRQFHDILIYILLGALALSVLLHVLSGDNGLESNVEVAAIVAILLLNALLGVVQEYRSQQAVESLRLLSAPQSRVRRDGKELMIPSRELVPGDVVLLEAGDRIAVDGKIVMNSHLQVNESSLTGESAPVEKTAGDIAQTSVLQDKHNAVFAGTLVTRGAATIIVAAIGLQTEIGKIASLVASSSPPPTPLEVRMRKLSVTIGMVVLALCVLLGGEMIFRGETLIAVILLCVSLAVSAVPEGLPAVVTACLAMGVRRMVKLNAIVTRMDALETLGSITIICSDKTGTITENRMKVVDTWVPHASADEEKLLVQIGASCNRAQMPNIGDPTEVGLLRYAGEQGIERLSFEEEEVPFTSEEKYMKTKHGKQSFLKGASEKILALSQNPPMEAAVAKQKEWMKEGLRVLGMAVSENGRTRFVGLVALEDPPRADVHTALKQAASAGIRTVMITGDHLDTARAVAQRVGIHGEAIEGLALDTMTEDQLQTLVRTVGVYARVSPQHKMMILRAMQANGDVVAMTGDGVNDAPALAAAHVGIAMGKDGTQVAREAASLVLADDRYATIVTAIREGRRIYDNIRKFVLFLIRANFAELPFIFLVSLLGLPLPYLPIHILWINLMTDGLPALALAMEPEESDVMKRPPRPQKESLFDGQLGQVAISASISCILAFLVFLYTLTNTEDLALARTLTFTFAILFELMLALSSRSIRPLWKVGLFGNKWLLWSLLPPLALQVLILFTALRIPFHLTVPTFASLGWIFLVALCGWGLVEFGKLTAPRAKTATF